MSENRDAAVQQAQAWTALATRVLAPNPGPMTLDGTNTYIVRQPGSAGVVVIDPGPDEASHLHRIATFGDVELILLTHHHMDHSESARRLSVVHGAPVRAFDADLCESGRALVDGEEIHAGGTRIRVVSTPGHTSDSISFHLPDDRDPVTGSTADSVLTGDTVLGRGTSIIATPDGSLRQYCASLELLATFGSAVVLPGHGPALPDISQVSRRYLRHRLERLRQVQSAVAALSAAGAEVTVASVADVVYPDVSADLRFAAQATVTAQLEYLAERTDVPQWDV